MRNNEAICQEFRAHQTAIDSVMANMPRSETIASLAELFGVFNGTTRVRIIHALYSSEFCVCDLTALLGMSQSAISHQLKILRDAGVVDYRRDGKTVIYFLKDHHIMTIFHQALEHITECDLVPEDGKITLRK